MNQKISNIRIGALLLLSAMSLGANAQNLRFGVSAGANFNLASGSYTEDTRAGYVAGATAIYDLSNSGSSWYVGGSLLLSQKGYKPRSTFVVDYAGKGNTSDSQYDTRIGKYDSKMSVTYLHIPVVFGKNFAIGSSNKLFVEAGPYVSVGLWGSRETKYTGNTQIDKVKTHKVFESNGGLNRFDCGVTVGVGAELAKHFRLKCAYELGLPNLQRDYKGTDTGTIKETLYNSTFAATLSYIF